MMAGVVSIPVVVSHAHDKLPKPECKLSDSRFQRLRDFFHKLDSPIEHLTPAFIQEADAFHLDWRLLPGLSVIESGAGKVTRKNNIFGWNNGSSGFRNVREGIHVVAERLANSRSYRGKSVEGKLNAYNPNEGYSDSVLAVMRSIAP